MRNTLIGLVLRLTSIFLLGLAVHLIKKELDVEATHPTRRNRYRLRSDEVSPNQDAILCALEPEARPKILSSRRPFVSAILLCARMHIL